MPGPPAKAPLPTTPSHGFPSATADNGADRQQPGLGTGGSQALIRGKCACRCKCTHPRDAGVTCTPEPNTLPRDTGLALRGQRMALAVPEKDLSERLP